MLQGTTASTQVSLHQCILAYTYTKANLSKVAKCDSYEHQEASEIY
jgi:hypothetical protein